MREGIGACWLAREDCCCIEGRTHSELAVKADWGLLQTPRICLHSPRMNLVTEHASIAGQADTTMSRPDLVQLSTELTDLQQPFLAG